MIEFAATPRRSLEIKMLVKVLESFVPYVGPRGTVKELPDKDAELLVLLGKVERVEAHGGTYERRDMQARKLEEAPAAEAPKPRRSRRRTAALAAG